MRWGLRYHDMGNQRVRPYILLYIQPVGEKGGMEVNLVNEIRQLDRTRFLPIAACLQDGPVADDLRALGIAVHLVPRGRFRNLPQTLLTGFRLLRLIKRQNVSLIISQNSYAHLYGGPAAFMAGKPVILRTGGVSRPIDRVDRAAFALGATTFIANSRFTERALVEAGVRADRVRTVYRGVNLSDYQGNTSGASVRRELGLSVEAQVITTVGRLQHWKGQHLAITAAASVVCQFPRARFLIVGDALFGIEREYPAQLRALVRELHLEEHVLMLGHRTDIPAILAASDVVLVPSVNPEPFGMVTIEAMAAGKPVIASNHGASREIVTEDETGFLVPPDATEPLAEAIMRVLANPQLQRHLGAQAQQVVRKRFTLSRAVRQYEGIYLECLRSDRRS